MNLPNVLVSLSYMKGRWDEIENRGHDRVLFISLSDHCQNFKNDEIYSLFRALGRLKVQWPTVDLIFNKAFHDRASDFIKYSISMPSLINLLLWFSRMGINRYTADAGELVLGAWDQICKYFPRGRQMNSRDTYHLLIALADCGFTWDEIRGVEDDLLKALKKATEHTIFINAYPYAEKMLQALVKMKFNLADNKRHLPFNKKPKFETEVIHSIIDTLVIKAIGNDKARVISVLLYSAKLGYMRHTFPEGRAERMLGRIRGVLKDPRSQTIAPFTKIDMIIALVKMEMFPKAFPRISNGIAEIFSFLLERLEDFFQQTSLSESTLADFLDAVSYLNLRHLTPRSTSTLVSRLQTVIERALYLKMMVDYDIDPNEINEWRRRYQQISSQREGVIQDIAINKIAYDATREKIKSSAYLIEAAIKAGMRPQDALSLYTPYNIYQTFGGRESITDIAWGIITEKTWGFQPVEEISGIYSLYLALRQAFPTDTSVLEQWHDLSSKMLRGMPLEEFERTYTRILYPPSPPQLVIPATTFFQEPVWGSQRGQAIDFLNQTFSEIKASRNQNEESRSDSPPYSC